MHTVSRSLSRLLTARLTRRTMNTSERKRKSIEFVGLVLALWIIIPHDANPDWGSRPGPADTVRWQSLGGGLTSNPSCVSWGTNRLDCFVRGTDLQGAMWHTRFDGSAWRAWQSLGGSLTSDPNCVSWAVNRLDCFVRGTDGNVWHKWWDGIDWRPSQPGWDPVGGETIDTPVAVARDSGLDLFVRRSDNAMWHRRLNGSIWGPWESLGGNLWSNPTCVSWGPNRLDCFAPLLGGLNGLVSHKWWDGTNWGPSKTGWVSLNGETRFAPMAVTWGEKRLDVFVRGTDDAMWHTWWDPNTPNWGTWESLGGVLTSSPNCVSWGENRLDCFVRGTDGTVWHKWWDDTHWGPSKLDWESIGGKPTTTSSRSWHPKLLLPLRSSVRRPP